MRELFYLPEGNINKTAELTADIDVGEIKIFPFQAEFKRKYLKGTSGTIRETDTHLVKLHIHLHNEDVWVPEWLLKIL